MSNNRPVPTKADAKIMSLVKKPNEIRLAMLGSTPGSGHPYSWSAMFNGYNREAMTRECPFAGIPQYLNKQPLDTLTIPGAKVTHICCIGVGQREDQPAVRHGVPVHHVSAHRHP